MARFFDIFPRLNRSQLDKDLNKLKNEKVDIDVNVNGQNSAKNTNKALSDLNRTGRDSSKVFSDLRLKMGAYLTTVKAVTEAVKGSIKTIKMYDDYTTDLANAMGSSRNEAESYLVTLNKQGKELYATTAEMAEGSDSLIRSGKSVAETETLLKDSLILSKVAKMESADATNTLLTVMNSYKKETEEVIDTVDALCAVDMSSAASADGLAISLGKSASAANMAGVEINKLIAYLAVMKEAAPTESDEAIGNTMKGILSRMNMVKAGAYQDENGEALNDVERVLTKVGISLRNVNGEFIESEKIIDEVGQKWSSFDFVTKRAVASAIGGSYHYNRLISLFEGYSKVLKYTEIAQNSSGKSLEKFGNYEESIEAKTKLLQNSLESLAFDTFGNEFYGSVLDATTGLIQFAEKTEATKIGLVGIGAVGGAKLFTSISTAIVESVKNLSDFNTALDIVKSADMATDNFDKLLKFSNGLSESQVKLVVSSKALSDQQRINILVARGMSEQEARTTLATYGLATAEDKATLSTVSLSGAVRGLTTKLKMFVASNPYIAVFAGVVATIGAVTVAIDALTTSTEEAREKAEETAQELVNLQSEISEINSELESTGQKIDEILAKDKIDPTDEEALKKLREQNDELERELRIKEALEKQAKKDASDAATEVFTSVPDNGAWKVRGTTEFYEETRGAGGLGQFQYVDRDRMQASLDYMNQIVELNKEIEALQKEQDKYAVGSTDFDVIQNKIDSKVKVLDAVQKALDTYIGEFQNEDDNLVAGISEETDNVLAKLDEIYDKYDMLMNYSDGTAITLTERLQDKFAHGADMSDASTYSDSTDMDKQISSWIDTLSDEDKKIMLSCELDNASLEELKQYLAEQKSDIEETATPEMTPQWDVSSTISYLNTQLKPTLDSLKSAYQDIFTEDGFTLDNVSSSMLASLKEDIDELNNMEGLDIDIPIFDFEEFATILTDVNTTESQAEEAFDKFATSIVNGVGATQNLSDETAGLVTQLLEEMGIVNASEIVTNALALQKAKASQETKILADTTYAEAVAMVNEAGATEIAGQALAQLALEKLAVNGQTINTSADIDNVIALANAAGASAEALATLAEAKAILAGGDAYGRTQQDWAQDVINKINNGTFEYGFKLNADDFKVDFNGLGKKEAGKAGKDAGEEYKKQLEKALSDLDDVLSGITDIIEDQIDSLNDQKDAAVDALEAQKKAAEEALEAEKKLLEEQKEGLQDKIDAKQAEIDSIKEAREQRQREFDLQKAQLEFERMQNQKTAFVYREGKGFGYKENTEGIRDARESVKEAQENITIASIEKEISNLETEIDKLDDLIESIDEQIEASNLYYDSLIENTEKYYDNLIKGLEDYKSRWEELGELEDQAKFEAKLKELGITTEDVLNMSESAFNTFKESYSNLLAELYQDNDGMISALSELTGIDFAPLSNSMGSLEEEVSNVSTSASEASTAVSDVGTSASTATSSITPLNEQLEKLQKLITEISNAFMSLEFPTIGEEGYAEKLGAVAEAFGNIATKCDTFSKIDFASIIGGITGDTKQATDANSLASGGTGFMGLAKSIQDAVTVIELQMNNLDTALGKGDTAFDEQIAKIRDEYIPQWEELQSRLAEIIGVGGGDNANTQSANANGEEGAGSIIDTLQTGGEEVGKRLDDPWLKAFEDFATGDNSVKTICEEIVELVTTMATSIQEQCALAATALNGLANNALAVSLNGGSDGNTAIVNTNANGTVGKAFANGTGNYKGLPHAEKNALRSEYGQPELTVYPNGTAELTTEPVMSDLPKGTVIFNEEQTKRIMNNEGTILGNAYANGTDDLPIIQRPDNLPSYLRPLQPGDEGYELTKKFQEHFKNMENFMPPVRHMMEQTMESVQSMSKVINTNTAYQQTVHNTYNVSLPNVTNESSAIQLMNELKQMSRDTYQYTHRK